MTWAALFDWSAGRIPWSFGHKLFTFYNVDKNGELGPEDRQPSDLSYSLVVFEGYTRKVKDKFST